jgi:hypothetical protein
VTIKGTGFTDHGHVSISYIGIPRTGEKSPATTSAAPVVGHRGTERAHGAPTVAGGAFTYQEDFPFTSKDAPHKFLSVQVIVKDDVTGHGDLQMVSAGNWVK